MKHNFLTILLLVSFYVGYAQTEQGKKMLGGNIGMSFNTNKVDVPGFGTATIGKTSTIVFSPVGGYFFMDGVAGGVSLSYENETIKEDGQTGKDVSTQFVFGPFGRYYHDSGVFGHFGLNVGSGKNEDTIGGNQGTNEWGIFGLDFGAGYAYFLNDNVAVEPMLLYATYSNKDKVSDVKLTDNGIQIRIGFNIFL